MKIEIKLKDPSLCAGEGEVCPVYSCGGWGPCCGLGFFDDDPAQVNNDYSIIRPQACIDKHGL